MDQDPDVRKQRPLGDVEITASNGRFQTHAKSDDSGFFSILVPPRTRTGIAVTLTFVHAGYKPLELTVRPGNQLLLARMINARPVPQIEKPGSSVKIGDVRIRYTVKTGSTMEVGTAITTFAVPNKGNQTCDNHPPCSPDGKWKASLGATKLNAPQGNEIRNSRVSCIAGPCPFTKVETTRLSHERQQLDVSALNWSDTATFLVEADIVETVVSDLVRTSYPIIFGQALNFTLPPSANGPSLQATVDGAEIVFPLGPGLNLSWANCAMKSDTDGSRLFSCELKPGYTFTSK
jgi:hypothetical protein